MAILFDDANTQFQRATWGGTQVAPISMSAWVYVDANQSGGVLGLFSSGSGLNWYDLWVRWTGVRLEAAGYSFGATTQAFAASTGAMSLNTWHHIAFVENSASSRFVYLDGTAGTEETTTTDVTSAGINRISTGRWDDSSPNTYMSGRIAETVLWDTNLTAAEILSLSKGVPASQVRPANLQFYDPMVRENVASSGDTTDIVGGLLMDGGLGGTAPTTAAHPRIYRSPSPMYLASVAAAGGGGGSTTSPNSLRLGGGRYGNMGVNIITR